MTHRDHTLQELLVTELGELTYAEKKQVKHALDHAFIKEKITRLQRQRRLLFLVAAPLFLFYVVGLTYSDPVNVLDRVILGVQMLYGIGMGMALGWGAGYLDKRLTIYRLLEKAKAREAA